ncbi:MAG: hypothetical protein ACE5GM_07430 [bacterium]
MDKLSHQLAVLFIFGCLAVSPAFAQFGMGMQMMKYFSPFGEGFNPGAIKKVKGTIKKVKTAEGRTGPMSIPVVMIVITAEDGSEYQVKLGPIWFIQTMDFSFRKGDTITVTGSLSKVKAKQQILCQTVEKAGKVSTYRNNMGIPVWSPIGRRSAKGGSQKAKGGMPNPGMMMQMMQGGKQPTTSNQNGQGSQQGAAGGGMQNFMMQMMQNMMRQRMGSQGGTGGSSFGGGFGRGFGRGKGQETGDKAVNTDKEEDINLKHQDLE